MAGILRTFWSGSSAMIRVDRTKFVLWRAASVGVLTACEIVHIVCVSVVIYSCCNSWERLGCAFVIALMLLVAIGS